MTGEISSKGHGENTLLEETSFLKMLLYQLHAEITEEVTLSLEDIITQKIKDKVYK